MGDLFGGSGEDDNEVDPDSSAGTISDDELTGDNSNNLLNGEAGNDIWMARAARTRCAAARTMISWTAVRAMTS